MSGFYLLQQLQTRLTGHPDVGKQDLRRFNPQFELGNGFGGRGETLERNPLAGQCFLEHPADGAVVIDDPDRFHGVLAHTVVAMSPYKAIVMPDWRIPPAAAA